MPWVRFDGRKTRSKHASLSPCGVLRLPRAIKDLLPAGQVHYSLLWDAETGRIGLEPCAAETEGCITLHRRASALEAQIRSFCSWASIVLPEHTARYKTWLEDRILIVDTKQKVNKND